MPPGPRPRPCSRSGSPSICSSSTGGAGACGPSSADGRVVEVRATHTVLATGGAGQLFAVTTNPAEATADGLAMALRAGVPVADVEFMQFHPTALHHPAMPRPLLSEALRGHGALLRDARGDRFVDELAPRDVVSRAMADRMREQGVESLWLDATGLAAFDSRFPTIAASLMAIGLDPVARLAAHRPRRPLPLRRGAHRPVRGHGAARPLGRGRGGLHRGARSQPAGVQFPPGGHGVRRPPGRGDRRRERTGLRPPGPMGAFLDGGWEPVESGRGGPDPAPARPGTDPGCRTRPGLDAVKTRDELQRTMIAGAGVVRSAESLEAAGRAVRAIAGAGRWRPADRAHGELANLVTASTSVLSSATVRCETRGAHARSDFPEAADGVAPTHRPHRGRRRPPRRAEAGP